MGARKVGVEEELLLLDPATGERANAAGSVLHEHRTERGDAGGPAAEDLEGELLQHMVETHTDPSADLAEIDRQLRTARRTARLAAEESGCALAAVATSPLGTTEPAVSANPRYERIVDEFGDTGRRAGTLGMERCCARSVCRVTTRVSGSSTASGPGCRWSSPCPPTRRTPGVATPAMRPGGTRCGTAGRPPDPRSPTARPPRTDASASS